MWLWLLGHLPEPPKTPRAIPSTLSSHYSKYTLERLYHKPHSPGAGRHHQHQAMLLKIQLRWAGHVSRMEDHRLPKIILYGELSSGLRNRGAPKKRYKENLKKSLGACNISHLEWTTLAEDCGTWRRTISKAASSFESSQRSPIEEKRQQSPSWQLTLCVDVCLIWWFANLEKVWSHMAPNVLTKTRYHETTESQPNPLHGKELKRSNNSSSSVWKYNTYQKGQCNTILTFLLSLSLCKKPLSTR